MMDLIVMDSGASAPITKLTRLAVLNRLEPELREIYLRAQSDVDVQIFRDKLLSVESLYLQDGLLVSGLSMLQQAGLLTAERVEQILTQAVQDSERAIR